MPLNSMKISIEKFYSVKINTIIIVISILSLLLSSLFISNITSLPVNDINDEDIYEMMSDDGEISPICLTNDCVRFSEKFQSSIDPEVDPCDNFYQYACGRWILEHPIPKHGNQWDQFRMFEHSIQSNLKKHLETKSVIKKSNLSMLYDRLYDFYHGCINQTQRNSEGYSELYKLIESFGGWPMLDGRRWEQQQKQNPYQWEKAYVMISKYDQQYLLGIEPIIDYRNTSKIIIKLGPPYKASENIINIRASVPDSNDNNDDNDDPFAPVKQIYMKLLRELRDNRTDYDDTDDNQLTDDELLKDINDSIEFQVELQKHASPIHSMQYYQNHYEKHLMNLSYIEMNVNFNLSSILYGMFERNFQPNEILFVSDFEYLKQLGSLLSKSNRVVANYLALNVAYQLSRHTTINMVELLTSELDSPEVLPNICYQETSNYMPELLGKLYVDLYFDQKSRENIHNMAIMLRNSFRELLIQNDWMDNRTIDEAVRKLDAMKMNIAYPDWYNNNTFILDKYSFIYENVTSTNYIQSVMDLNYKRQLLSKKLVGELLVDDGDNTGDNLNNFNDNDSNLNQSDYIQSMLFVSTSVKKHQSNNLTIMLSWPLRQIINVNAFYYFTTNGVYLPAGIIQDGIYLDKIPRAITFGSIGMILGHEMTHAFDSSGQLYDEHGELRNWWTNHTRNLFTIRSNCFVEQYSNYSIQSTKINGKKTLAENIADNGGLREAYHAFKTNEHKDNRLRLPGSMSKYTPDQLFFISFAHMWCANMDQSGVQNLIKNSVHSPPSIRVQGTLANFEPFSRTFNCSLNKPMNPQKKCILW